MMTGTWHCKTCMCALMVALIIIITTQFTDASPTYIWDIDHLPQKPTVKATLCDLDPGIETLCQRCAKSTKSNTVYPLCCDEDNDVLSWCERYLNFGIHK